MRIQETMDLYDKLQILTDAAKYDVACTSSGADMAASFEHRIDEILAEKLLAAAKDTGAPAIALAGGVAANSLLRCLVNEGAQKLGARLFLPEMKFCGDNGAMVAAQGFYELQAGNVAGLDLNGLATLPIDYNGPA